MLSIMNAAFKTSRIIAELKEQKGEPVPTSNGPRVWNCENFFAK